MVDNIKDWTNMLNNFTKVRCKQTKMERNNFITAQDLLMRCFNDNSRTSFFLFLNKTYVVGADWKHHSKALLMNTHNICFYGELKKIIPKLSPNIPP